MDERSPLFVDLDGTFVKTDMLFESFLVAVRSNILLLFMCFFWLIKGKSYLKHQLAKRVDITTKTLPVNKGFYRFLQHEKEKDRKIILATASDEKFAKSFCENYSLFDSYISSNSGVNLKGEAKLSKIKELSERFSYAGNSKDDFVIFKHSEESYLVNPDHRSRSLASKQPVTQIFDDNPSGLKVWLKQLRVHQWLKNCLIFVPLLTTGEFTNPQFVALSLLGFVSFCLLASATYIVNDLVDLESDRGHVRKRNRPIAAGDVSLISAKLVAVMLFGLAFILASTINSQFVLVLITYLVVTLFYSLKIKRHIGVDVITLASLYTIRIIAGAMILGIHASFWLLSFSMFIFLSLALLKRCAELKSLAEQGKNMTLGRDYNYNDYPVVLGFGTSSAMLAVLMFCFYLNSGLIANQYQQPDVLWIILPALCYWLMRMWIKTHRGEMHDDPIVYSISDKGSMVIIGFIGMVTVLAKII